MLQLTAFYAFADQKTALTNMRLLNQSKIPADLENFLLINLPNVGKSQSKKAFVLAVQDQSLALKLTEKFGFPCRTSEVMFELFRGVRAHFKRYAKNSPYTKQVLEQSQLGLSHANARNKLDLEVNRDDTHIIQSVELNKQMHSNWNSFFQRIKEWYGAHFPELAKILIDGKKYVEIVEIIGDRDNLKNVDVLMKV